MRLAWLWVPPLVYAALIFHLSSETNPLPEVTAVVWDKALHATEYAGLAFLLCRALRGSGFGWPGAIVIALILASAYAATDEWHQSFVPGRDSDVHDWLADTIGAVLGSGMFAGGRLMISGLLNKMRRSS
jgi:VanZ family protein